MQQTSSYTFTNGTKLNRIYDNSYYPGSGSCDTQCGSLALWGQYLQELMTDSHEYYNQPDGTNKFFRCVTINCYSRFLPFPNQQLALALTYSRGDHGQLPAFNSQIDIQYFDPTVDPYRFPAALSHEVGHAYHNWAGLYGNDQASPEIAKMWEKMCSSNHTTYDPNNGPWKVPDGRTEGPWEQFANDYRYFFGTINSPGNTRSSSGSNSRDPVITGFEDPANHLDWKKMMQFLPELCSMVKSYGIIPGSISWNNWYYQFQIGSGQWVYMDYYYTYTGRGDGWHYWNGSTWVQWAPSYTRV